MIERLSGDEARAAAGDLAAVLVDCVDSGASASFLAPLAPDRAVAFWLEVAAAVDEGTTILLASREDGVVVGTVQVKLVTIENQPHRADIAKLLVHRRARRSGRAAALMTAAEEQARAAGRDLLVLDTEAGSDASRLYRRLGWTEVGSIPGFALDPFGQLCSATIFWKRLA